MKIGIISIVFFIFLQTGLGQQVFENFDQAKQVAAGQDKLILMIFSGSDWCKPCIQLKTGIIETESFQNFKKKFFLHLEVDFPYHKSNRLSTEQMSHNESLAERYNKDGTFPKVLIVDETGKVLGSILYKQGMTPSDFIAQIKNRIQI